MKIRAIEVEEGGVVTRWVLRGQFEKESSWPVGEGFKYRQREEKSKRETWTPGLAFRKCECGHEEWEHMPVCNHLIDGCRCEGYVGKANAAAEGA